MNMARKVPVPILFDEDMLDRLDDFTKANADKYTSRSDVVRVAVEEFLQSDNS
jgi:metal-responsive CopG/Arc/MetJ family transcriptional regulator